MVMPCPGVDAPTDERLPIDVAWEVFRIDCAWCRKFLSGPKDGRVSHSICPPCSAKWLAADAVQQQAV